MKIQIHYAEKLILESAAQVAEDIAIRMGDITSLNHREFKELAQAADRLKSVLRKSEICGTLAGPMPF